MNSIVANHNDSSIDQGGIPHFDYLNVFHKQPYFHLFIIHENMYFLYR